MKQTLKTLLIISILLFIAGCTATPTTIPKQYGTLNLKYDLQKQQAKTSKTIAIVSPRFLDHNDKYIRETTNIGPDGQIMLKSFPGADIRLFQDKYRERLVSSFNITMYEILSKKGFLTKGPFENFDDITYSEKKQIYLTIIPTFDFALNKKVISNDCSYGICHEVGILQLGGSVSLKVIEPLTKQAIINTRINLSDFKIEEKYTYDISNTNASNYQIKYKVNYQFYEPQLLNDNFDLALTNLINSFYKQAFEKIQKYISRQELLDQEADIVGLKKLKRF